MSDPLLAFRNDQRHTMAVRDLAARGDVRRYRKGTLLIQEGDAGETVFVLLSGRVKVYSADNQNKEITFGVYGAGEYVGEMALDGGPRSANVITLETTVCSVVSRSALLALIAEQPEFALVLLSKVIHRLRLATRDARNLAFIDVYGRLTRCLLGMATPQPDGTLAIADRITHQEIASRVGCSREMVSRILKDLERGGYLRRVDRRMVLLGKLPQRW
jgi:CRP/FNR family cyclic AMP-dependent transcriptional regulator